MHNTIFCSLKKKERKEENRQIKENQKNRNCDQNIIIKNTIGNISDSAARFLPASKVTGCVIVEDRAADWEVATPAWCVCSCGAE